MSKSISRQKQIYSKAENKLPAPSIFSLHLTLEFNERSLYAVQLAQKILVALNLNLLLLCKGVYIYSVGKIDSKITKKREETDARVKTVLLISREH